MLDTEYLGLSGLILTLIMTFLFKMIYLKT